MEKRKNCWVIPTDKPSRLHLGKSGLVLCDLVFNPMTINSQHIYITSDEEIKEGDWYIDIKTHTLNKACQDSVYFANNTLYGNVKSYEKIILTTDPDLIKDGVQKIDDEFLQWFVKNPSCESVEVDIYSKKIGVETDTNGYREMDVFGKDYRIIIPQEEPIF